MKKFVAILVALIMVLGMIACTSQPATTTETPKADGLQSP